MSITRWRIAICFTLGIDFCLLAAGSGWAQESEVSQASWRRRICPPEGAQAYPSQAAPTGVQPSPAETRPNKDVAPDATVPSANDLAAETGAAAGPESAVPNMIGDFFGGGAVLAGGPHGFNNVSVGIAGGDRRFKIVEGNNPVPTDRVFFDYNHFTNPLVDVNGDPSNLERFRLGVEKTFFDGLWSAEFRIPFSADYNSTQSLDPGAPLSATEFGDLAFAIKRILVRGETFTLSTGLGIVFPTGPEWKILNDSVTICEVRNEAVHLQPFLGAAWYPTEKLFVLGFAQIDFDTHGNTVLMASDDGNTIPLAPVGVYHEQSLGFFDVSAGYWLFRRSDHWLTGVAPMVELHYSTTMQNTDAVRGGAQGDIAQHQCRGFRG